MLDLLRKRRSIRRYRDEDIEPEVVELLKEAALRSPTSRNFRPWRFVFVTDRGKLAALSRAKESGSSFLAGARLGVVVCADERVGRLDRGLLDSIDHPAAGGSEPRPRILLDPDKAPDAHRFRDQ